MTPSCDIAEIRVVPERFAAMHVRQMHFDERNGGRRERVAQGDAGVRERRRVDDGELDLLLACGVDPVDERPLVVALERDQSDPRRARARDECSVDVARVRWP